MLRGKGVLMSRSLIQVGRPVRVLREHSREYRDHQRRTRCSLSTSESSVASLRTWRPRVRAWRMATPQIVHALVGQLIFAELRRGRARKERSPRQWPPEGQRSVTRRRVGNMKNWRRSAGPPGATAVEAVLFL
jgi:hypothetical protein